MAKFYRVLILLFTAISFVQTSSAQVNFSAAAAINDFCVGGGYKTVGNIVITETNVANFGAGAGQTYIISVPANFEFNTGVTPTVTATQGTGVINIVPSAPTTTTFTFTYEVTGASTGGGAMDQITISNIQVRAVGSANTGSLARSGGTATINGNGVGANVHCAFTSLVAPGITTQPANNSGCVNDDPTFTVVATGTSITYSWDRWNLTTWTNITSGGLTAYSGDGSTTLTANDIQTTQNGYKFRVTVANACGSVTSDEAATLTVGTAADVTNPGNDSECAGGTATFSVTGTNAVSYQWQERVLGIGPWNNISDGGAYSGATTNTLSIVTTIGMSLNTYRCVVTGSCGSPATSNSALLTVNPFAGITAQPPNRSICETNNTTFTVTASNASGYQWEVDPNTGTFGNVPNAAPYSTVTSATLTITGATTSMNNYKYRCVVSSASCGTTNSNSGTLTVASSSPATFFGLETKYCKNSAVDTLEGFPVGGTFSGSGVGATNMATGKAPFDATGLTTGSKTITYTYGCTVVNKNTTVYDTTNIVYTSPAGATPTYVSTDPPVDLVVEAVSSPGSPLTGTYAGTGVSGTKFYPNIAGAGGPYAVSFTYTNTNGCNSKVSKNFTVVSSTTGIPPLRDNTPFCQDEPYVLLDETTVDGGSPSFTPGSFEFDGYSGTGIVHLGGNSYAFYPTTAGSHVIYYNVRYYFGFFGFWFTIPYASQSVTVNAKTALSFTLPSGICNSQTADIDFNPTPAVITGQNPQTDTKFSIVSGAGPNPLYYDNGSEEYYFDPNVVTTTDGPQTYTVRYTYVNASGCASTLDKVTNVFLKPEPPTLYTPDGFWGPQNQVICRGNSKQYWGAIYDPTVTYEWHDNWPSTTPVWGYYYFYPPASSMTPTTSPVTIPYYVTKTQNGCTSDPLTVTYQVNDNALVDAGSSQVKCMGPTFDLTGTSERDFANTFLSASWSGGTGTFSNVNSLTPTYTPSATELPAPGSVAKTVVLTLTSVDPDGSGPCTVSTDNVVLTINPVPAVDSVIISDTAFCKSDDFTPLSAVVRSAYSGTGVYSDTTSGTPGVVGSFFHPSLAGIGEHRIYYKFTDINNCSNYHDTTVNVYAVPSVSFTVDDFCATDSTFFTDGSSIAGGNSTLDYYKWDFGDGTTLADTSRDQNTFYKYKATLDPSAIQTYTPTLTVRSNKGCSSSAQQTITIGNIPDANFRWQGICPSDQTSFFDMSQFPSAEVNEYLWDFGDGTIIDGPGLVSGNPNTADRDPQHQMLNGPGAYFVKFRISSIRGCVDSITQRVDILDQFTPTPQDPYAVNFATSDNFWAVDGVNASWQWGPSSKSTVNTGSRRIWITDTLNVYNVNEDSHLNGPCLNMQDLEKPMIALKIWSATADKFAGAVLQSSTDGGASWQLVGKLGDGLNWYDGFGIQGSPGGQMINQYGWTGTYSDWKIAKINLNDLAGLDPVRFRIAFASGGDLFNLKDGFAIDSVWIGERDKMVVIENFTNTNSATAATSDGVLNTVVDQRPEDVVAIHYHTSFPNTPAADPMNLRNQADPSSRVLMYGVTSVPHKVLDGNQDFSGGSNAGLDTADIDKRALETAKFSIKLFTEIDATHVDAKVKIYAKDTISNDLVVHMAVVERTALVNSTNYQWVLTKLMPNASGSYIEANLGKDDSIYLHESWDYFPGEVYDPAQLAVIVFIQDIDSKEIYQAAYQFGPGGTPTGILKNEKLADFTINVFPNPTHNFTNVSFEKATDADFDYMVFDELGNAVARGFVEQGTESFKLETSDLISGMYVIRIGNEKSGFAYRKLVINH